MQKEVYHLNEFCEQYKVSRTFVYNEINRERLKVFKCRRSTLISITEAERWFHQLRYRKTKAFIDDRLLSVSCKQVIVNKPRGLDIP